MKIYEQNNQIILQDVPNFNLDKILGNGEGNRWNKELDGSYTGVVKSKILNIAQDDKNVYFNNTNLKDFQNIWFEYFDLGRDYDEINNKLKAIDNYIGRAVDYLNGMRILGEDEWEMMITFIISANNSMTMLQKVVENLSEKFGDYLGEHKGRKYYAFPTPKQLSLASLEDIRSCKTGYRYKYIKSAADNIVNNGVDIYKFKELDTKKCIEELKKFDGVGTKVADCIALFGMKKYDTFPMDVWMQRIMKKLYIKEDMSIEKIRKYSIDKFGELSAFVQQYLFHYVREVGLDNLK